MQVDSSLSAIDRIAQTTAFQGQALLNGQLDFQTAGAAGTNHFDEVSNLAISQATLGSNNHLAVNTNVTQAATQATVDLTNIQAATAATNAYHDFTLAATAQQGSGSASLTANGSLLTLTATATGAAAARQATASRSCFKTEPVPTRRHIPPPPAAAPA